MSQTLFLLYRPEAARPMLKTRSVGAHSICARGGYCVCRGDHWSPANLPQQRIFRDSFLQGKRARASNARPYKSFRQSGPEIFLPAARFSPPPPAGGAPSQRGPREGAFFACCACKRIYFRLRLVKNHLMWYTISLQVHRQTRCKPATQSYRGPSGQPVANKKLLFYCRR